MRGNKAKNRRFNGGELEPLTLLELHIMNAYVNAIFSFLAHPESHRYFSVEHLDTMKGAAGEVA